MFLFLLLLSPYGFLCLPFDVVLFKPFYFAFSWYCLLCDKMCFPYRGFLMMFGFIGFLSGKR